MYQTKDSSVIMKTLILLALFGIASAQIAGHPGWEPKQVDGHPEWKPRGIFFFLRGKHFYYLTSGYRKFASRKSF